MHLSHEESKRFSYLCDSTSCCADELFGDSVPTHVGALAGLTGEERAAAMDVYMGVDFDQLREEFQRCLEGDMFRHAPVRTLREALALKTKKELCETARNMGCSGYSKLTKERLVVLLEKAFMSLRSQVAERFACSAFSGMLDQAKRVWSAGGMLRMDLQEHRNLPGVERFHAFFPLMNVFEHGGKVFCAIPDEIMEMLSDGCWKPARERAHYIEHARHLAEVYVNQCGLVREKDLVDLYRRYYPAELDGQEFCALLHSGIPGRSSGFDLWSYGSEWFLVHPALLSSEEAEEGGSRGSRIYGDMMLWPTHEERFRRYVLERHEGIVPWEVPSRTAEELEEFIPYDAIMATPSHRALQAFLDAHVPDGQNDYLWADKVIDGLVTMARFGCSDEDHLIAMRGQVVQLDGADELRQLESLIACFIDDVPCWLDNGWSPNALAKSLKK